MAALAERGATVTFEIQRGGVEEGDRQRAEQRFAMLVERLLDRIGAITCLTVILAIDRLAQPGHRLIGVVERQNLCTADLDSLLPGTGMAGGGGDQAVEQAGVRDLVAAAQRLDDALDVTAALADVLDEVEVLVAADLLDTNERGWCPD